MVRALILCGIIACIIWAPWMATKNVQSVSDPIFSAFGPVPATCFDVSGKELKNGIQVHWFPMGRMLHTCSGDFILWMWGAVQEAGGVYKKADDVRPVQGRPLTCTDVLERHDARHASSSTSTVTHYTGPVATQVDTAAFPDARSHVRELAAALAEGPNFAGSFTVAEWACGQNCHTYAVIDARTGRLIAYGPSTDYGIAYTLDSDILITNPLHTLPKLSDNEWEKENTVLSIARVPREYLRLTSDALSGTQYLVRECVESATTHYIDVEDDRLDVAQDATDIAPNE